MMRDRQHRLSAEVDKRIAAVENSRHAARDRCLLWLMCRHGVRVSEAWGFRVSRVDIESREVEASVPLSRMIVHPKILRDHVRFLSLQEKLFTLDNPVYLLYVDRSW